jgi:hypothetical protein
MLHEGGVPVGLFPFRMGLQITDGFAGALDGVRQRGAEGCLAGAVFN